MDYHDNVIEFMSSCGRCLSLNYYHDDVIEFMSSCGRCLSLDYYHDAIVKLSSYGWLRIKTLVKNKYDTVRCLFLAIFLHLPVLALSLSTTLPAVSLICGFYYRQIWCPQIMYFLSSELKFFSPYLFNILRSVSLFIENVVLFLTSFL